MAVVSFECMDCRWSSGPTHAEAFGPDCPECLSLNVRVDVLEMADSRMKAFYDEERAKTQQWRSLVQDHIDNALGDLWRCDLHPDTKRRVEEKLVEAKMWIEREPL